MSLIDRLTARDNRLAAASRHPRRLYRPGCHYTQRGSKGAVPAKILTAAHPRIVEMDIQPLMIFDRTEKKN